MAQNANPRPNAPSCPICGTQTKAQFRPFCSRRCADVDLARWLSGKYAFPGGQADADEDGDDARAAEAVAQFNKTLDQEN